MRKTLFVLLLTTVQLGCATDSSNDMELVALGIGKLLVSHDEKFSYQHDLNPFGSAIMFDEFVGIYNNEIKELNKDARIKFFWAAMWHQYFPINK